MWKAIYLQSLPMLKKYPDDSLPVDSDEVRRIRRAARDNQIYVSLGFSEMDHATTYLAQVLIDPEGNVVSHRRKIKPTHAEKLVYGDGSGGGDTFLFVVDTELGRLGQLDCWENMDSFLQALGAAQGEQVRVTAWPVYPSVVSQRVGVAPDPHTDYAETASDLVTPAYAFETGTWTLAPFQRLSAQGLARTTPEGARPESETDPAPYNGPARIYRPDGSRVPVVKPDKDFDGWLYVDTRRKGLVTEADPDGGIATYSMVYRLRLDKPLDGKPDRESCGRGWEGAGAGQVEQSRAGDLVGEK